MEDDQQSLIYQTENLINERINLLEVENSSLTEKVLLRESQINQTSSDLQEAYTRLIRQSQEECNFYLNEILNEPKKEFLKKSQSQLQSKLDHLRENIKNQFEEIEKAEVCVEISKKYELLFEKLVGSLLNSVNTKISNINMLSIDSANELICKLQVENNDDTINQYYQKKNLKLKKLEDKISKTLEECNRLTNSKKQIKDNISQLSSDIVSISQKISISIHSKEMIQLEKQNFEIMSIEPVCQKRKMPVGNLLVLAPIHSLTRKMNGTQGVTRFFTKKNNFH